MSSDESSQRTKQAEQLVLGVLFFGAMAAVWYRYGYSHSVAFGGGAVFTLAVVGLGIWRIEQ